MPETLPQNLRLETSEQGIIFTSEQINQGNKVREYLQHPDLPEPDDNETARPSPLGRPEDSA